jgi:hypothetical protein
MWMAEKLDWKGFCIRCAKLQNVIIWVIFIRSCISTGPIINYYTAVFWYAYVAVTENITVFVFLVYDMSFIYCIEVSTQWQWSLNLYKNRKDTAIYRRRNST